jgi:hypothetical protein
MLATPKNAHTRNAIDTPATDFSSLFDNDSDSALSSVPSSVCADSDDETEQEKEAVQQQSNVDNTVRDGATQFDRRYYATCTLASRREQRKPRSQPVYSDFYAESRSQSVKAALPQATPQIESEHPSPAVKDAELRTSPVSDHEEQPLANAPRWTSKRKQQASVPNVTLQPPKKKIKETIPIETPPELVSGRQLRKRKRKHKVDASASEMPPPPTKKAKKTPTKARPKSSAKPKSGPKSTPKSKTKSTPKSSSTKPKELSPRPPEIAKSTSGDRSLIAKIRMPPAWLEAERAKIIADDASTSPGTSFSTEQNTSFASTRGAQSISDGQDQCAQQALAPVPASSQLSSADGSQVTQPQEAYLAFQEPHQSPDGHESDAAFLLKFGSPQERLVEENEQTATQQDRASQENHASQRLTAVAATRKQHMPPPAPIYDATQPTQPWIRPELVSPPISEGSDFALPESLRERFPEPLPQPLFEPVHEDADIDSDATTECEEEIPAHVPRTMSQEQQQLYKVAKQLFANRKLGSTKPAPAGQPEVWADGRQELCETLHYYRAYQSACYSTGGFVRGFMFDKVAHGRDYIDGDVVVSRAGGGLSKDKDSGEMRSNQDQTDDTPVVQALKNCMKHFNPVVVITGVDNPHIPSQPPHQYCVMDYFKPTHIWFEKSGKSKILRYRFEKLNTQKDSWWKPENKQDVVQLGELGPPVENICDACGETSLQIYLNGWMCLQPSCSAFWHTVDGSSIGSHKLSCEPDEESLTYDPRFLKQKTPWLNDNTDYPLSFGIPEVSTHAVAGENTSQAFWSGIVCPDCGKCNARLGWMGWDCSNPTCTYTNSPPHSLIPATSLRDPFWPLTSNYTLSCDTHSPLISTSVFFAHGYRINRYTIPGLTGSITHMIANRTVVSEPGGPASMFEELQQTDIDLRRRAMPNGQLKGESYCRHFTVNYGMPYKFIASTASHSFDGAARPITATRSRLNWAAKFLLAQESGMTVDEVAAEWQDKEFNEILALGYFEAQKINYHDDGEFGLGPTIATLSLGASGTMRIRMKARHYHGCSNAGVYDDSAPLPGCQMYEQRLALHADLAKLKRADGKAYRARLKQIPKELGLKSSGNAKDVLRMEVAHGDIVVMHGAEVQKYYEHAVEHAGKLRFALTCRYIEPGSLSERDKPAYTVGRDEGGYDGSKIA